MKIKIFADGANISEMLKIHKEGIVRGLTTNPTLLRKAGVTNYEEFAKNVLKEITDMPISFEVLSDDFESMEKEAVIINDWGKNTNVKIPITNTKGESSLPLIKKLLEEGVQLNITAVLSLKQIIEINEALSFYPDSEVIVSIFAGRIADTGVDPIPIMKKAVKMFKDKNVEVLWASSRELLNIIQAEKCGCHIITVTPNILSKLSMIGKDLDELSLDTVKMFMTDAIASGFKI